MVLKEYVSKNDIHGDFPKTTNMTIDDGDFYHLVSDGNDIAILVYAYQGMTTTVVDPIQLVSTGGNKNLLTLIRFSDKMLLQRGVTEVYIHNMDYKLQRKLAALLLRGSRNIGSTISINGNKNLKDIYQWTKKTNH